jgi:hypothetical protein
MGQQAPSSYIFGVRSGQTLIITYWLCFERNFLEHKNRLIDLICIGKLDTSGREFLVNNS